MRLGDCGTCRRADRGAIEAAHASGEPTRTLARRLGVPESSLRRHLRDCRRPEPARRVRRPVTREHLESVAAEFAIPFGEVLAHYLDCLGGDVEIRSPEEGDELLALLAGAAPCDACTPGRRI